MKKVQSTRLNTVQFAEKSFLKLLKAHSKNDISSLPSLEHYLGKNKSVSKIVLQEYNKRKGKQLGNSVSIGAAVNGSPFYQFETNLPTLSADSTWEEIEISSRHGNNEKNYYSKKTIKKDLQMFVAGLSDGYKTFIKEVINKYLLSKSSQTQFERIADFVLSPTDVNGSFYTLQDSSPYAQGKLSGHYYFAWRFIFENSAEFEPIFKVKTTAKKKLIKKTNSEKQKSLSLEKTLMHGYHEKLKLLESKIPQLIEVWKKNKGKISCAAFCTILKDKGFFIEKAKNRSRQVRCSFAIMRYGNNIKVQLESSKKKELQKNMRKIQSEHNLV